VSSSIQDNNQRCRAYSFWFVVKTRQCGDALEGLDISWSLHNINGKKNEGSLWRVAPPSRGWGNRKSLFEKFVLAATCVSFVTCRCRRPPPRAAGGTPRAERNPTPGQAIRTIHNACGVENVIDDARIRRVAGSPEVQIAAYKSLLHGSSDGDGGERQSISNGCRLRLIYRYVARPAWHFWTMYDVSWNLRIVELMVCVPPLRKRWNILP